MSQQIDLTWASSYITKMSQSGMQGDDTIRSFGGGQEGLAAYLKQLKTNDWAAHHKFMNAWGAKKNRDKAKKEKRHTLTFTITANERQQLKQYCKKAEMTIEQYLKNATFNLENLEKAHKRIITELEEKHANEVREINLANDLFGPENITKMAEILEKLTTIEQQNNELITASKSKTLNDKYIETLEKGLKETLALHERLYAACEEETEQWVKNNLTDEKKAAALAKAESKFRKLLQQ